MGWYTQASHNDDFFRIMLSYVITMLYGPNNRGIIMIHCGNPYCNTDHGCWQGC
jgi:hypothetical protein